MIRVALLSLLFAEAPPPQCAEFKIDPKASKPMVTVPFPPKAKCQVRYHGALVLPDPACTPGAVNPTVTEEILRDPKFTTKCVRNDATSEAQKRKTYAWYGIKPPKDNSGENQVCELDHVVSLELGGGDTLDNLWPQCGPDAATLNERWFKLKDKVENYLAREVKAGRMKLADAQTGIASDWTQYVEQATKSK